jgi:hypothetical protein
MPKKPTTQTKDQTSARHHYLPKMYLEGFTEGGRISTWDRASGGVRTNTPNNVANVRGFYTFTDKSGNKSDELEKLFAEIEGYVKNIILNLNSLFPPAITGDTKLALAQYVVLQHLRTPAHRKQMEQSADMIMKMQMRPNLQSRDQIVKQLERIGQEPTEQAIKQLEDFYKDPHSLEVVPSKESVIKLQLNQLPVLTQILMHRVWNIVTFEQPLLITSDDPILLKPDEDQPYWWMRGTGFANAKEIWFPLSSTRMLVLSRQDYKAPRIIRGTAAMSRQANEIQLDSSYMEAFGPPSIIQQYKGKPLGARPLGGVDAGFDNEFFDQYNKPPDKPRPHR